MFKFYLKLLVHFRFNGVIHVAHHVEARGRRFSTHLLWATPDTG